MTTVFVGVRVMLSSGAPGVGTAASKPQNPPVSEKLPAIHKANALKIDEPA